MKSDNANVIDGECQLCGYPGIVDMTCSECGGKIVNLSIPKSDQAESDKYDPGMIDDTSETISLEKLAEEELDNNAPENQAL